MEDALLRLENAILEETRMVAAEALKGIHALQGIFEDRMRDKKGVLQGLDERMKVVGQRDITVRKSQFNWLLFSPFTMSLWSDAENAAGPSQMANDVDTAPVIGLSTVPGATRNVDNEKGIREDIGARFIDGAHS
jgi:hypothetical protein